MTLVPPHVRSALRPWSFAKTPVLLNPRKLPRSGASSDMVPYETALTEYMAIMESPTPFDYLESGFVIWEGPSPIDGAPLVAIVTGVRDTSGNVKTGAMLQTWIMRKDISPQEAVDTGGDRSICGDCGHRAKELETPERKRRRLITKEEAKAGVGIAGGETARSEIIDVAFGGRPCYVVVAQAPMAIWKAYHRGNYTRIDTHELPLLAWGRLIRIGSYGDPAMVPSEVWRSLAWDSVGWTGYTHQWEHFAAQPLKPFVMASVDSVEEMHRAQSMGWRTFRVMRGDEQLVAGLEISCPASQEGGSKKQCDACRACQGAMPGRAPWRERPSVPSVGIKVHPRWQVLFYPRGKKGKKLRGHRPDVPPTRTDPKKKPSEIVLLDYLSGADARPVLKDLRRAEKSSDPAAVISSFRGGYPSYLQGYFDSAAEALSGGRKTRKKSMNPRGVFKLGHDRDGWFVFSGPLSRPDWRSLSTRSENAAKAWLFRSECHGGARGGYSRDCHYCAGTEARLAGNNPVDRHVDPQAFGARARYREDMEAGHGAAEYWRGQAGAFFTGPQVKSNPLLAIVGNPRRLGPGYKFDYGSTPRKLTGKQVRNLMTKAKVTIRGLSGAMQVTQKRVRQVRERGVIEGVGYVYDWIQGIENASRQSRVAGAGSGGRVKTRKAKVKKNRTSSKGDKKPRAKKKRVPLSEAKKRFDGFGSALSAYEEFHDEKPGHVDVYAIDDGRDEVTVERVHAALHRTLETNYMVPWKSSKHGTLWLHEHKEGAGLRGLQKGVPMPNPEDLPLEVYDPATKTTRKFGGRFKVSNWWYD